MDWTAIRNNAAAYFGDRDEVDGIGPLVRGIGPNDILNMSTGSLALYVGPIDWTWGLDDKTINHKVDLAKIQYLNRCNQVEILIREAGDLIERALGDVLRYDELNIERFKVMTEFVEFDKTDAQQTAEKSDDAYWNGLITEADLSAQAKSHLNDNSAQALERYQWALTRYNEAVAVSVGNDIARQNASGAAGTAAATLHSYAAQVAANTFDRDSHTARREYETRARTHQLARQAITREMIGIKLNEVLKPGGALNYNERMREIGVRALNDFLEVVARMGAIDLGLREFFAVTDPELTDIDYELNNARTRIEGALNWLRMAANVFARATLDEQEYIVRLTLEGRSPSSLLEELRKGYILSFAPELIEKLEPSRLRGVSATAEGLIGDAWIDLEISSPQQELPSNGLTLPSVFSKLGRVSSSGSMNERDTVGGRPMLNRSPLGDWIVHAVRDDRGDDLTRLHFDFHLAFG